MNKLTLRSYVKTENTVKNKILNFINPLLFNFRKFLPNRIKKSVEHRKTHQIFYRKNIVYYKEIGLGFIDPPISQDALDQYYKQFFWQSYGLEDNYYSKRFNGFYNRTHDHYNHLSEFLDFRDVVKMLDFGAGYGNISNFIKQRHPDIQIHGVEPGDTFNYLANQSVFTKLEKSISDIDTGYDLIYTAHSLEHVADFEVTFKKLVNGVVQGGIIFIETPCDDYEILTKNNLTHWPHTYFFSKKFFESHITENYNLKLILCERFGDSKDSNNRVDYDINGKAIKNDKGYWLRTILKKL